jgi:hypothetical protein
LLESTHPPWKNYKQYIIKYIIGKKTNPYNNKMLVLTIVGYLVGCQCNVTVEHVLPR